MENLKLFKNFSEEYLSDSKKFADWITSLYWEGFLRGHDTVKPFAEELTERFFLYSLPLQGTKKEEFISKFNDKTYDSGRRSFSLEAALENQNTSCCNFRASLIEYIVKIRKEARECMYKEAILTKEEISDLFYHLAHNMGGSDIYNDLSSISNNVSYYRDHGVITDADMENYLQNYNDQYDKPLEKFKQNKTLTQ